MFLLLGNTLGWGDQTSQGETENILDKLTCIRIMDSHKVSAAFCIRLSLFQNRDVRVGILPIM